MLFMYICLFSDAETVKLYGYYAVQNIQNGDPYRIAHHGLWFNPTWRTAHGINVSLIR